MPISFFLHFTNFGQPKSAFLFCSFWLVQAFAKIGEIEKARLMMKNAIASANSLGLFSEHYRPNEKQQVGNFPQAYSHVGQINATFSISPPWPEIL